MYRTRQAVRLAKSNVATSTRGRARLRLDGMEELFHSTSVGTYLDSFIWINNIYLQTLFLFRRIVENRFPLKFLLMAVFSHVGSYCVMHGKTNELPFHLTTPRGTKLLLSTSL